MKTLLRLLALLGLFLIAGCGEKQSVSTAPPPSAPSLTATNVTTTNSSGTIFTNSSSGNPLTAPADYISSLGRGKESAIKTVDIASLNQAIQMFNVDEGRYPKDLNELVEKQLITRIPDAPYGLKLDYDPNTGVIRVVNQ